MYSHLLLSYFRFIFAKLYLQINKRKFGKNLTKIYFENGEGLD